ncbi:glycoside hydrolase family 19 protein [Marichromatium purpuratum]|nr:glycoside hydrolase family 19 protein [Marichromatium purpuratum]
MRRRFGGRLTQQQVDGTEALLAAIECEPGILCTQAAYILATAWHETARTMQPVRETLADSDGEAIRRLDRAWAAGRLPQVSRPYWRRDADGQTWLGRGHVQLTHRTNYARASELVGVDLLADPSRAMDPAISATILVRGALMGLFTGHRLANYLTPMTADYIGARRVINGRDRARDIAAYAHLFERTLKKAAA